MREQRIYNERSSPSGIREPLVKFIILAEGSKTEPLYFEALNNKKTQVGIPAIVQVINIERTSGEQDWSNPKKLLDRLLQKIKETPEKFSYTTFIDACLDYFSQYEMFKRWEGLLNNIKNLLFDWVKNDLQKSEDDLILEKNLQGLSKKAQSYIQKSKGYLSSLVIDDLTSSLEKQFIVYSADFDKICIVVDRDSKSFTEKQYDDVFDKCNKNNFNLYVSNPCFEFWLLLHFDGCLDLNKEKLLRNEKIPVGKSKYISYTESELKRLFPSYSKNDFDVDIVLQKTDTAILNEKKFCENISDLKTNVGSNIGQLIISMRGR